MWQPAEAMADLELKRTPGDRRLYSLEGVGKLRLKGFASRTATTEAGGSRWRITRHGFGRRDIQATDAAGTAVVAFEPRALPQRHAALGRSRARGGRRGLRASGNAERVTALVRDAQKCCSQRLSQRS